MPLLLGLLAVPVALTGLFGPDFTSATALSASFDADPADVDCDGVPDAHDAFADASRSACRLGRTPVVPKHFAAQVALVARDPRAVPAHATARVDAAFEDWAQAFRDATGGRVAVTAAAPAFVVQAPPGASALDAASVATTAAAFAHPDAARGVHFLVIVAFDLPVAGESCGCVAWHQRARNAALIGAPMDATSTFGAPAGFIGVTGIASYHELDDRDEMAYRFVHETAHAWCCRFDRATAPDGMLAARGAHWHPELVQVAWGEGAVRDPLAGDGSEDARRGVTWRFLDATLVIMGVLDPHEARPVVLPDSLRLSAFDALALGRPAR